MASDIAEGISFLLDPLFADFKTRLEKCEATTRDLQRQIHLKEDTEEVSKVREHVEKHFAHLSTVDAGNRERLERKDKLRAEQIEGLSLAVARKAEKGAVTYLSEQLQVLTATVSEKAEHEKQEEISKQLSSLSEFVCTKSSFSRVDDLAFNLSALTDVVATKATIATTTSLDERLAALAGVVAKRATNARADDLALQLQNLSAVVALKAENAEAKRLDGALRLLAEDVARRAQGATVEEHGRKLAELKFQMSQKTDCTTTSDAIADLRALTKAVGHKTEHNDHTSVNDLVLKLREDLYAHRVELDRITNLDQKVEVLSNTVQLDSSKVKNLSLLFSNVNVRPVTAPAGQSLSKSMTPRAKNLPPIGGRP